MSRKVFFAELKMIARNVFARQFEEGLIQELNHGE